MTAKTFTGHFVEILKEHRRAALQLALLHAGLFAVSVLLSLAYEIHITPVLSIIALGVAGCLCATGSLAAARMAEQHDAE